MVQSRSFRFLLVATLAAAAGGTVFACGSEEDGVVDATPDAGDAGKKRDSGGTDSGDTTPDEDAAVEEDDAGTTPVDGGVKTDAGSDSGVKTDAGFDAGTCAWPTAVPKVVITQIYSAGGNTDSTYKNDFVELYNRTDAPVSVDGWSVQYASSTGAFPANAPPPQDGMMPLTGTIPAHGFYLVRAAKGLAGTMDLPAPDATAMNALLGQSNGKLALVRSKTALGTVTKANLADAAFRASKAIEDFVGYGSATAYEGAKAVEFLEDTLGAKRKDPCVDTDDNAADFAKVAPAPRNSSTTGPACACPK